MDSEAEDQENLRFVEKRSNFRGSAKVLLKHLYFHLDKESDSATFLDHKNVARLVQVFKLEGCNRLDLEHRVPVLIDEQVLHRSLQQAGITSGDLLKRHIPPELIFPGNTSLRCLHGRHRIAAAKEFLEVGHKWWTIDFYSNALSETSCRDLQEEYANSRNFCDGDIYRQIRYYQKSQNQRGEGRWFARLSEGKRKDLKQLQRREDLRSLSIALDRLLPFIGFWPGLQIGTFHRILNLKCSEELVHYLNHIRIYWNNIIDEREDLQSCIDYQTVQLLQSRCPKASALDNGVVMDLMHSGKLFPLILDGDLRSRILSRIKETEHLIPSLHTFLEDTKWLEPCAKVLGRLLPKNHKSTIRRSLINCYTGAEQEIDTFRVEKRNLTFVERIGSIFHAAESGYRQLWLFAWRHFPELSATVPRKDIGKPKPKARASNEQRWQQLAGLAKSLGFESEEIKLLNDQDPDSRMTLDFLGQVRPGESYHLSDEIRSARVRQICHVLKSIVRQTPSEPIPEPKVDGAIPVDHRCGRPHEHSHTCSKAWFFLNEIYEPQASGSLSHFSVNRDIFLAFFGFEPSLGAAQEPSVPDIDRSTEANVNGRTDRDESDAPAFPPTTTGNSKRHLTLHDFNFTRTSSGRTHSSVTSRKPVNPQASLLEDVEMMQDTQSLPHSLSQSQSQSQPRSQYQSEPQSSAQQEHPRPYRESEDIPQGLQNQYRYALLEAGEGAGNTRILVQGEPRLFEALDLFELYEQKCRLGDLFLVWIDRKAHRARGKHIQVDSETVSTGGKGPPEDIMDRANDHYFNVYSPSPSASVSELKCVEAKNIYEYIKGPKWDGVVYAFEQNGKGVGLQRFQGESTKARLQELESMAKKRSRSGGGSRMKIPRETIEDVDEILAERNDHLRNELHPEFAYPSAENLGFVTPGNVKDIDTDPESEL